MTTIVDIRDAAYVLLITGSNDYKTKRKTPVPQLTADGLPALSVFVAAGRGMPDGDGNVGPIAFVNDETLAISIARGFEDPAVLEGKLDAEVDAIKAELFTNAEFTKLGPDGLFEAVTAVNRRWVFPQQGEAYFAELRLEITFRFREVFEPVITDDLEGISVSARPLLNPNAPLVKQHILDIET